MEAGNVVEAEIIYAKTGAARFLSHLDLNRLFQRALRRSLLPITYNKGFNPKPRISYERALALGKKSKNEKLRIFLKEEVPQSVIKKRFQAELPDGIRIRRVRLK